MTTGIPVMRHHSVADSRDRCAVAPAAFATHVQMIAESGRTPLTVSELAACLRSGRPLPQDPICRTFEDGYADTRRAVETVLGHGLKPTVYATSGSVGWPRAIGGGDLAALNAIGSRVELGPRSITDPHLCALKGACARREILGSKEALTQLPGLEPRSFAYPHGAYDRRIRQLVIEASCSFAVAVKNTLTHSGDDPWAKASYTVMADTSLAVLEALISGRGVSLAPRRGRSGREATGWPAGLTW